MKTRDLAILGGASLLAYYFLSKNKAAQATGGESGSGGGGGGLFDLSALNPFNWGQNIIDSGAQAARSVISNVNPQAYIQAPSLSSSPLTAYDKVGVVAAGLGVPRSAVNPFVATAGNAPTTGVNYGTYSNAQGQGMSGYIPAGSTNYTSLLTPAQVRAGQTTSGISRMPPTPAVTAARRILMNNGRL